MKKLTLTFALLMAITIGMSQPSAFKYQTVMRDANGEVLASQPVSFQISILQGSASGTNVYTETHTDTTNQIGLVTLEIGSGILVSGNFGTIDWGNDDFFLQIELDETGGGNYLLIGTSQLLSVPYAIYSENSGDEKWGQTDNDISFMDGNVGIGTQAPEVKLEISSVIRLTPSNLIEPCGLNLEGSIYYDDYYKEYCYCDDTDPNINPGATEICDDEIDNDCDGLIDGGDSDCY